MADRKLCLADRPKNSSKTKVKHYKTPSGDVSLSYFVCQFLLAVHFMFSFPLALSPRQFFPQCVPFFVVFLWRRVTANDPRDITLFS